MAFTPKDWKDAPDHSTPLSAAALEDLETRVAGYADSLSGGSDTRTILHAISDRAAGYWNPATTSTFDNLDASPVILEISAPGIWLVGFEGYVTSADGATVEADVALTPLGTADPFDAVLATYPGVAARTIGVKDEWFQAIAAIVVTDPVQIAAFLYPQDPGAMQAKVTANPDTPRLFAWPV